MTVSLCQTSDLGTFNVGDCISLKERTFLERNDIFLTFFSRNVGVIKVLHISIRSKDGAHYINVHIISVFSSISVSF